MNTHTKSVTQALLLCAANLSLVASVSASITQTNYGTGDGSTPGGAFASSGNLLRTNLASSSKSGSFYREDSGYNVDLTRLYDGRFGNSGTYSSETVMPNLATIRFDFDAGYDLTSIKTYASWDTGRSGQRYTVNYATADDPTNFRTLYSVAEFNNDDSVFPTTEDYGITGYNPQTHQFTYGTVTYTDTSAGSSTMVSLTSSDGLLASNVSSLQFVFNGYQNNGTAFREFQVTAAPEPSTMLLGLLASGLMMSRRKR